MTLAALALVPALISQSPSDAPGWRAAAPLEEPRAGVAAAVADGLIYAVGGSGLLAPVEDVDAYDPADQTWFSLQPLPTALERMGVAALSGRVYAAGGYTEDSPTEPVARMWVYDIPEDAWAEAQPMPAPRANFSLVAADGRLFALGGTGEGAGAATVFDASKNGWRTIGPEPLEERRGATALALDGRIFVIGGLSGAEPLARVDIFDIETEAWTAGPALPGARYGHAAAVVDGRIHVAGGRDGSNATLASHLVLDPAIGEWSEAAALPAPRSAAAGAGLPGEFYVIGGGAGGGFFAPFTAMDSVDVHRLER